MVVRRLVPFVWLLIMAHSPVWAQAQWMQLGPGLEFREFSFPDQVGVRERTLSVLRIDPGHAALVLGTALENGGAPLSVLEWADELGCAAIINASMYRADSPLRSTGYLRHFDRVNNGFMHPEYGAFLVFNPYRERDARVRIVDRSQKGWRDVLGRYGTVIQNFRLIDAGGKNLWPEGGEEHSIAAVAVTRRGDVLFLFCEEQVSLHAFNEHLLSLSLDLAGAMYVEGGSAAGLYIRTRNQEIRRLGRHRSGIWGGSISAFSPVPNVLGVAIKK